MIILRATITFILQIKPLLAFVINTWLLLISTTLFLSVRKSILSEWWWFFLQIKTEWSWIHYLVYIYLHLKFSCYKLIIFKRYIVLFHKYRMLPFYLDKTSLHTTLPSLYNITWHNWSRDFRASICCNLHVPYFFSIMIRILVQLYVASSFITEVIDKLLTTTLTEYRHLHYQCYRYVH